jgi:type IV pilus assembly protein PilB
MNTGYKGRTGVYEVLMIDDMIQEMILNRQSAREINRAAQQEGKLLTLKDDATSKVCQGITTLEEAAAVAMM